MIYGAILAGGVGNRIEKHDIPKQFIKIGKGIPIIIYTLREFLACERIDRIYVSVVDSWRDYFEDLLTSYFSAEKRAMIRIVGGGKERLDSFSNILNAVIEERGINDEDILICHDSVRPFVQQKMIDDCITATLEDGLALTVIPTTDTIHVAHEDGFLDGTLDRKGLFNGQNPSGFSVKLLKKVLDETSDEEKSKITGTTQLMLSKGYRIRIVEGHTSNFKITTDKDLDLAEIYLRGKTEKGRIDLLDCTLRDGGIVIDFDFGNDRIKQIKTSLEKAGVQFIECGYVDRKKGTDTGKTRFDSIESLEKTIFSSGKKDTLSYVAMIDYGTYDFDTLPVRRDEGIDGIRLAFHKENYKEAVECGRKILEKGYGLYIQPMVCLRYSDEEYIELIELCNENLRQAKAFYIVDSFGQMDENLLARRMGLVDNILNPEMAIGLHAHNNRQLAYSNSIAFLDYQTKRDKMIDSSIMGMGKGAGNLCTELIAADLMNRGNSYELSPVYEIISDYFSGLIREHPWGYCLEYYLSSVFSCTPSYIKIFKEHDGVSIDDLIELIRSIPDEKRVACDAGFAHTHLEQYLNRRTAG